jgi:ABC transport system ATP-binding/permease protein
LDSRSLAPTLSERTTAPARLVVITPKDRFTRVLLRQNTTIGRAPDADICITEEFVSGHQAKLVKEGDTYRYLQLGKTNPTFLHGKPIESHLLQDGDILFIGPEKGPRVSLQFEGAKGSVSLATLDGQSSIRGPSPEGGRFLGTATLDKKVIIGRDPKNALVLESMHISRQHAFVEPQHERHLLRDLGSTNGTYVNGERVTERRLQEGDVIRIGHFKLIYQGNELRGYDEERAVRLDAKRIVKQADDTVLLHDISLSVLPGELLGIVGTSGSGKSTLMDALNGVRPASSGVVLVNGSDLYRQFDAIRPLLGYVPQFPTLHESLPLERALFYSGRLRFPPDVEDEVVRQRAREAMRALEIEDRAEVPVGRLSGGQQKRASIAAELMTEPGLFFLDEPASGLDPGMTRKFMEIIRKLADEGRTVILVTHDTESLSLCDVMVFLDQGRMIYAGRPEDAPAHFGVKNLGEIYTLVSSQKHQTNWERSFKKSPKHQEYVVNRQENIPEPAQLESKQKIAPVKAKARLSSWQQWKVLFLRYLELWRRDPKTLAFLIVQAPLIAGVLLWVFGPESMSAPPGVKVSELQSLQSSLGSAPQWLTEGCQQSLSESCQALIPSASGVSMLSFLRLMIPPLPLFIAAAVTWFGVLSAVRELVKELPIFRRERLAGLRVWPYFLSKMMVLGLLCLAQVVLFWAMFLPWLNLNHEVLPSHAPGVLLNPNAEIFITLLLTSLVGMSLGLLVSAFSDNLDQAQSLVPMVLIPQLVLACIPPDAGAPLQWLSYLSVVRWALEAMGSTMGFGGGTFPSEGAYLCSRWLGLLVLWGLCFGGSVWLLARRKLAA